MSFLVPVCMQWVMHEVAVSYSPEALRLVLQGFSPASKAAGRR